MTRTSSIRPVFSSAFVGFAHKGRTCPVACAATRVAVRVIERLEARRLLSGADGLHGDVHEAGHEGHELEHAIDVPLAPVPAQVTRAQAGTRDDGAIVTESGQAFFFDAAPAAYVRQAGPPPMADGGTGGGEANGFQLNPVPAVQPGFSSNPSSPRKIFLDFDGHVVSNTIWNQQFNNSNPIHGQPYSTDGDIFNFSAQELANIQEVWRRTAEDFAPFNVDVTTIQPPASAFTAGATALRVMISTDVDSAAMGGTGNQWFSNAGGVAYLGSWRWTSDTPVWVFENNLGNGFPKYVTEAASHEVGHGFDLNHDGTATQGYYGGHGSGPTGWAPIMGVGYSQPLSQWSKGEYSGANNTEDDIAVITQPANSVVLRNDAVGGTTSSAANLSFTDNGSLRQFSGAGIIERRADADVWRLNLTNGNGRLTLQVAPFFFLAGFSNLDIKADLLNSAGTVIQSVNPVDDVDAFFDVNLTAGTYYVRVDGVGKGNPLADGYTDYGSLGQYDILADYQVGGGGGGINESGGHVEFQAEASSGQAPGSGAAANHTWNQVSDTVAQGGAALLSTPNTSVNTGEGLIGPRRDYAINFTTTGTYYVWVRLKGTIDNDSVHVGMNGSGISLGRYGVGDPSGGWKWLDNIGDGGRMTVNISSPGTRTFNLWMREDGVQVDAFVLTKNANFRPDSGSGNAYQESAGRVDVPAEGFHSQESGSGGAASHVWNFVTDSTAQGPGLVLANPNSGLNTLEQLNGPKLNYLINFTNTGTYYLWTRLKGTIDNDSVHVGMNGAAATLGRFGLGDATGNWKWLNSIGDGGRVTVSVPSAGQRTLNLWMREDGVRIDGFILTRDANFNPNDGGGGGGGGGGEATVTFENLSTGNLGTGTYSDPSGFVFTNLPGTGSSTTTENFLVHGTAEGFASKVVQPLNWGRKIVVRRGSGAAFDLTSFDYAAGRWGAAGDAIVTGYFPSGNSQTTVSFNSKTLTRRTLNWANLTRLEINFAGGANDTFGTVDNFIFAA